MTVSQFKKMLARPATGLEVKRRRLSISRPAKSATHLDRSRAGPIVVAGLFRTSSGIGASARVCAEAFERHGIDVQRCDLSAAFNQVDLNFENLDEQLPDERYGTLILHLNAPETLSGLRALKYCGRKRWRIIGYWVWELETLPASWSIEARHLSEIWTPSEFSARAIRKAVNVPVKVVPHFVVPPSNIHTGALRDRVSSDGKIIGVFADGRSSFDRKNLIGGVRSFIAAAGKDVDSWLLIKTRNLKEYSEFARELHSVTGTHERVIILDASVPESKKWDLINACDIIVSLHRSEGFGLVLAEAMSLGKCVIATNWSGNLEFMDDNSAGLVPFNLISAEDSAGLYAHRGIDARWADADIEYASNLLNELINDHFKREAIGKRAQAMVERKLDGTAYIDALQ